MNCWNNRKRLVTGDQAIVVKASNMLTNEKCSLIVQPKMIDEQDLAGLEALLREHVELEPTGVNIYL